jgi:aryl-alcohol dehydrogenase-like predicted oxidoreductase
MVDSQVISKEDVTAGIHCMHPRYLAQQFEASRQNLGLETVDLMYIHNAYEAQAATLKSTPAFMDRLKVSTCSVNTLGLV